MKNIVESQVFSLGTGSWDKEPGTGTAQEGPKSFIGPDTDPDGMPEDYDVQVSPNNYGGTTAYQVLLKSSSEKNSKG